jgi:hypothetical protein
VTRADASSPTTTKPDVARLALHETADGWRLTISPTALIRLAELVDEQDGELILLADGELTMELHPNLVPGEPFDVTGVLIADEE